MEVSSRRWKIVLTSSTTSPRSANPKAKAFGLLLSGVARENRKTKSGPLWAGEPRPAFLTNGVSLEKAGRFSLAAQNTETLKSPLFGDFSVLTFWYPSEN